MTEADALSTALADLVHDAGAIVMHIYESPRIDARLKRDASPVTLADERAEEFLLEGLARLLPGVPVIAEESVAKGVVPAHGAAFLLVDPLDGTREFIARSGEFTVNVALIDNGAPVAGAIGAPALSRLWRGGGTAFTASAPRGFPVAPDVWRPIAVRKRPAEGLRALASRSHGDPETERFLAGLPIAERIAAGSSLKFCRLAEGVADVYPRFGPTMEWDIAAGDAVLTAAGGAVTTPDGARMLYGKRQEDYRSGPFVAWGDPPAGTRLS